MTSHPLQPSHKELKMKEKIEQFIFDMTALLRYVPIRDSKICITSRLELSKRAKDLIQYQYSCIHMQQEAMASPYWKKDEDLLRRLATVKIMLEQRRADAVRELSERAEASYLKQPEPEPLPMPPLKKGSKIVYLSGK